MNKGPTLTLLLIASILIILYIFLNKETSYDEFDTLGKFTIYVKQKEDYYQELIYVDKHNEYFVNDHEYIFKSEFLTFSLKDALLNEVISIEQALQMIPDITMKPTDHIEVGKINAYTIYQSERIPTKCKQTIEYFYLDDLYEYYFNCSLSQYYLVRGTNKDYTLTEALEEKFVTIEDLKELLPTIHYKSITYQVIQKKSNIEIVETAYKYNTINEIEIIYLLNDKLYYFESPQSKFYKIKVGDNYLRIQDALANKVITIDELRLIIPEIAERS